MCCLRSLRSDVGAKRLLAADEASRLSQEGQNSKCEDDGACVTSLIRLAATCAPSFHRCVGGDLWSRTLCSLARSGWASSRLRSGGCCMFECAVFAWRNGKFGTGSVYTITGGLEPGLSRLTPFRRKRAQMLGGPCQRRQRLECCATVGKRVRL